MRSPRRPIYSAWELVDSVGLIEVVGGVGTLELPETLAGFSVGVVPAFPRVTPAAAGAARGRGGGGKLPRVGVEVYCGAVYRGGLHV
jgi:hypothetical protein